MEQNEQQEKKMLWGDTNNALVGLFAIIFIVFVFFRMMFIIFQNNPARHMADYNGLLSQFAMPVDWSAFIKKPWTLFTYMFTNTEYIKIMTNGVWVMGLGYLTQQLVGNKHIIPSFLYGALAAGIALLVSNTGVNVMVSGSELGILSLATTLAVAHKSGAVLTGIPNKVLVIALAVLYAIILFVSANSVVNSWLAYAVAIATGAAYGIAIKNNNNPGAPLYELYETLTGKSKSSKGIIVLAAIILLIIVAAVV